MDDLHLDRPIAQKLGPHSQDRRSLLQGYPPASLRSRISKNPMAKAALRVANSSFSASSDDAHSAESRASLAANTLLIDAPNTWERRVVLVMFVVPMSVMSSMVVVSMAIIATEIVRAAVIVGTIIVVIGIINRNSSKAWVRARLQAQSRPARSQTRSRPRDSSTRLARPLGGIRFARINQNSVWPALGGVGHLRPLNPL